MTASRYLFGAVAVFLAAANLGAQGRDSLWVQELLPPGSKVIETADLNTGKRKARVLALWMLHPDRVIRQGDPSCSDSVYGDHWYGPARLSLIDLSNRKLMNTVEIRGLYEGADEEEHGFPIPFRVSSDFYYVPQIGKNKEGAPKLLNLHDLTGEGVAGQFVPFEYEACGAALTTALGYSVKTDAAAQFQVEISEQGGKTEVVSWVPLLFSEKAVRPGQWSFTWEPGHGADGWIHEEVSFDPARQLFVGQRRITPFPDPPARKKKARAK